jgi:hypothetical protein
MACGRQMLIALGLASRSPTCQLVALLATIVLAVRSVWRENIGDQKQLNQQIRDLMVQAEDLDKDLHDESKTNKIDSTAEEAINNKRSIYLERIEDLEREIKGGLKADEYVKLAELEDHNLDPDEAEYYYLQALKHARSYDEERVMCEYLGTFYSNAGYKISASQAEEYFNRALDLADKQPLKDGQDRHYERFLVYNFWANASHSGKHSDGAYSRLSQAAQEIQAISQNTNLQQMAKEFLSETISDWADDGDNLSKAPSSLTNLLQQLEISH